MPEDESAIVCRRKRTEALKYIDNAIKGLQQIRSKVTGVADLTTLMAQQELLRSIEAQTHKCITNFNAGHLKVSEYELSGPNQAPSVRETQLSATEMAKTFLQPMKPESSLQPRTNSYLADPREKPICIHDANLRSNSSTAEEYRFRYFEKESMASMK